MEVWESLHTKIVGTKVLMGITLIGEFVSVRVQGSCTLGGILGNRYI